MEIDYSRFDDIKAIIDQISDDKVRSALESIRREVLGQAEINARQDRRLKSRLNHQEWLEVPIVAAIAFFILLCIGLVSVQVSPEGVTFDALSALKTILEAPAMAAIATAVVAAVTKKLIGPRKERADECDAPLNPSPLPSQSEYS